ncbi:kinesin-like protein KIN-14G [Senna tora]|uniref:Kinesin-like protein KIN-14G n=1 Tax=Senna tora TaxID=362788 RepID=A0A834SJ04_9FABA|nr:kinesin-like protein KIN-14G [Senna tora]
MATEKVLAFSVASVVEEVLQQHGTQLSDINLASRQAEEACMRRYEAAGWLRKKIGVVGAKDLPAQPSEHDFKTGLRSGIILCNVLNKLQPGAVVEGACDSHVIPDGAALSAFQYFENVRNFLVALQEMGLPTFEASDLEKGGKCGRIVNCVLALKSYSEWIEGGKHGSWKYAGNTKPSSTAKPFFRKNSEPFIHPSSSTATHHSLNSLVRQYLSDKKQEEIPIMVESLLTKVMEEFQRRMPIQHQLLKTASPHKVAFETPKPASQHKEMEELEDAKLKQEKSYEEKVNYNNEESSRQLLKQQTLVEQQNREIQELKKLFHHTKTGIHFLHKSYQEDITYLSNHLQGLASAASGYHKVVEENRNLYNQLQDLKGNIRVYCRVRPFLGEQSKHLSSISNIEEGTGSISIITTPSRNRREGKKTFSFNRVFGPCATQEEVFSDTRSLIRSVLDGYNVCIFAYGQTGSGKTFTMSGPKDVKEESMGVNYRALRDLFHLSEQRKDTICYEISVQMLEIYNDQIRDLLVTDEIRNSSQNGINVPDANLAPVSSTSDVIYLMNLGQKNRAVGATAMNDRSSRSHSCVTVHVEGKDLTSGNILRGCMHLVDLAGSERVDKSEVTGDRLKEAQHINKSLSALGDVISSLSQKNAHVPYRNSKLTQLLQDSLGGQAKTLMFVHISPEHEALGETISTLKFAERVSSVELGTARVNKDSSPDVKELKEQIACLKAALSRKEGEAKHFQHSEIPRPRSHGSSPKQPSWMSGSHRKPKDDSSSLEGQKKAALKLKRRSLDPQDMYKNSSAWPLVSGQRVNGKEEDKVSVCEDWVDKMMLKRQDSLTSDDNLVEQWEAESKELSQVFNPSKICLEHSIKVTVHKKDGQVYDDVQRNLYEVVTTDESDHELELELATSDSSESDLHWLVSVPKPTSIPNGLGSKPKKLTQPTPTKNPEARSMIPSLIPSPSRKEVHASQPRKQSGAIDAKRRTGNAK